MLRSLLVVALACSAPVLAQTADFDTQAEGIASPTLADGGLVFQNLSNGLGGLQLFVIEQADATLGGFPEFTPQMTLGFSACSPGPNAQFSRVISFELVGWTSAVQARVELFSLSHPGNTITLQALSGAVVVASHTVTVPAAPSLVHHSLFVAAPAFDRLRVVGGGQTDAGAFFAVVDHVVVSDIGAGTEFCFGDGSGAACPCSNTGIVGRGCDNSAATGGARLDASGTTRPDTLVLLSRFELPSVSSVLLQGSTTLGGTVSFGDGLRCIGGTLLRLYTKSASGGTVIFPNAADLPIGARSAALGDSIPAGASRLYQVYYRDPDATFCPAPAGDAWNASNARSLVW